MTHRKLLTPSLMALAFGACCTIACNPRSAQQGLDEELSFSYQTSDSSRRFDRPIAQGASIFVRVEGADEEQVSRIESHSSEREGILRTRQSTERADELVVTGLAVGESMLNVSARLATGGDVRSDRINFDVARPSFGSLGHHCTSDDDAAYLQGLPIFLDYGRYDSQRRRLVGKGACGVNVSPSVPGSRVSCDETSMTLTGVNDPGPLLLNTGLGRRSSSDRNTLGVQVIGLQKLDFAPIQDQLREGATEVIELRPQTESWPICSKLRFSAEILTPRSCTFTGGNDTFASFTPNDENRISIRGELAGDCAIRVSLPAYGIEDVWEFSIPVFDRNER